MPTFLRRVAFVLLALPALFATLPAHAAALAQPTDNNLHVDRGVLYGSEVFLSTSGGTAPYRFSFTGPLPAGISVASDGLLSGVTCGSNGNYPLGTVTVTDAVGATASRTGLTLIVNAAPAGGCSLTVSGTLSGGTVGSAYSGGVTAGGGTPPYTYSIASGSLPTGVSLSSTGTLSGTPSAAGSYSFTVLAEDFDLSTGTKTYTLSIASAASVSVAPTSLPAGVAGVAYAQALSASGGTAPYGYAVTAGSLPAGLSLAGANLSGTPSAAGSSSFTITATDAGGATGSRGYTVSIGAALSTTQAVASRSLTAGVAASAFTPVTAAGGSTPYGFAVAPALPAGLSLNTATGQITGTPSSASASTSYTVTVTDANGSTSSKSFTLVVGAALSTTQAVASSSLTAGVATSAFTPVTASGGSTPYAFAIAPALPAGLSLNTGTGQVSGTPSAASASTSYTVTVTDANGSTSSKNFTLVVGGALSTTQAVASGSLTAGVAATAFTPVTASGGSTPYSFAVAPALPAGLSLNTVTGQITGTPSSSSASTSYTVTVTDANGSSSSKTFTLAIGAALSTTQAVASSSLTAGVAASAFTPVTVSGGSTPYSFAVAPALPAGLSLNAGTGQVSGTPSSSSASTSYTVTVTDANGSTSSKTFTLVVGGALGTTQAVASSSLTAGVASSAFTPVTAAGGSTPYAFSIAPALPAGLSFDTATGQVSGTPSTAGASAVYTVTVTDANGSTSSKTFTLAIGAALSTTQAVASSSLTAGVAANAFTPVTAAGGSTPYGFAVAPALPAGLSLNTATGQVSGTPSAASASTGYTVTVTDANGSTSSKSFTLVIGAALGTTQAVASSSLTAGVAATAFTPVTAAGGSTPYGFAVAPALPAGLSLNTATGQVSGTPSTASASAGYTVTVTDANGSTSSKTFTLAIGAALSTTQAVASSSLTAGVAANAFTPVTAAGGSTPYGFAVAPALPAGLSLNTATGQVSGTPSTASASAGYTVTVTDANGSTSSKTFTLAVGAALATTQAVATSSQTVGAAASAFTPVTAAGGRTPYAFAIAPALPAGLSLDTSSGQVSGTPSAASASAVYTVTVTDANGSTSGKSFTLVVAAAPVATITLAPASLPAGIAGLPYTQALSASGGRAPYTYRVGTGSLPAGLALSGATLAGTPAAAGAASVTITATDANGASGSRSYTLSIGAALAATQALASQTLTAGSAATAFVPVTASGGSTPYRFAIAPALPAGLSLNAATGQISGTPTAASTGRSYTIGIVDANGQSASRSFTLVVGDAFSTTLALASRTLERGQAAGAFTPVTAAGGTPPYRFAIVPALPAGLVLDAASGAISGSASAALAATRFTISVGDAAGAQSAQVFSLVVQAALGATVQVPETVAQVDSAVGAFTPVVPQGGVEPFHFTVAPSLPPGLAMNPATGEITGAPQRTTTLTTYTVTIVDAQRGRAASSFRMATRAVVRLDVQPRRIEVAQAGTEVNLSLAASGGSAPYRFSVRSGQWPAGLVMNAAGVVSGRARSAGTLQLTVRVTDARDAVLDAVLTVVVLARPDPTLDPVLRGLQLAQAEAAQRYGSVQLRQMIDRLADERDCVPALESRLRLEADWRAAATPEGTRRADAPAAPRERGCSDGLAGWVSGSLVHGRTRGSDERAATRFSTPGLTLGWDAAVADGVRVGVALGHGQERGEVADSGRIDARSDSLAVYASWRGTAGLRLSAALGQGQGTLALQRSDADDGSAFEARRRVRQQFAAVAASARLAAGGWRVTPQLVLEQQDVRLGAVTEDGNAAMALAYDEARLRSHELRGGVTLAYPLQRAGWQLEPALQFEWRHRRGGDLTQTLRYADEPGTAGYTLHNADPAADQGQLGLGLRARGADGWSGSLELRSSLGGSGATQRSVSAGVQRNF